MLRDLILGLRIGALSGDSAIALVVIVAVLLLVLVIVIAFAYVVRLYSPRGRLESLLESRIPDTGATPWVARAATVAILLAAVWGVSAYAGAPSTCVSCHQEAAYVDMLAEGVHGGVRCMGCHGAIGPGAGVENTLVYARWSWSYYANGVQPARGSGVVLDVRTCLGCHRSITEGVSVRDGIRVRHDDFLRSGVSCEECHADIAHVPNADARTQAVMNYCLGCHNDADASAECETCHERDLALQAVATKRGGRMDTVATADTSDCYRCHDQVPCYSCHGITMPHPPDFALTPGAVPGGSLGGSGIASGVDPGSHARAGFASREVCWRCHHKEGEIFVPDDAGCSCHGLFGSIHGGTAWVQEHGLQATGRKSGLATSCEGCHGPPDVFCTWCHPASYAGRYDPLPPGPDDYPRDRPLDPEWWDWFGADGEQHTGDGD